MGNSPNKCGDKKTESVAWLEKLREPIKAPDMRSGPFFVRNLIALKYVPFSWGKSDNPGRNWRFALIERSTIHTEGSELLGLETVSS